MGGGMCYNSWKPSQDATDLPTAVLAGIPHSSSQGVLGIRVVEGLVWHVILSWERTEPGQC